MVLTRWATVVSAGPAGVFVRSSWTVGTLGPLPATGEVVEGQAVLVTRTAEGDLAVIAGGSGGGNGIVFDSPQAPPETAVNPIEWRTNGTRMFRFAKKTSKDGRWPDYLAVELFVGGTPSPDPAAYPAGEEFLRINRGAVDGKPGWPGVSMNANLTVRNMTGPFYEDRASNDSICITHDMGKGGASSHWRHTISRDGVRKWMTEVDSASGAVYRLVGYADDGTTTTGTLAIERLTGDMSTTGSIRSEKYLMAPEVYLQANGNPAGGGGGHIRAGGSRYTLVIKPRNADTTYAENSEFYYDSTAVKWVSEAAFRVEGTFEMGSKPGSPEGVVSAASGTRYRQIDSPLLSNLLWVKHTDGGNTGWVPDYEGRWVDYVPTWTATGGTPTLGNGALSGKYTRTGKEVHFRLGFTFGSTTSVGTTTTWLFGLPVPGISGSGPVPFVAWLIDAGTLEYMALARMENTSSVRVMTSGTSFIGAAKPMTWANGDQLLINGTYEAA